MPPQMRTARPRRLAFALFLVLAPLALTQCRMIANPLATGLRGAESNASGRSACVHHCNDKYKACKRDEETRHHAAQRGCESKSKEAREDCKKQEARRHSQARRECVEMLQRCKRECRYVEGAGRAGR